MPGLNYTFYPKFFKYWGICNIQLFQQPQCTDSGEHNNRISTMHILVTHLSPAQPRAPARRVATYLLFAELLLCTAPFHPGETECMINQEYSAAVSLSQLLY